jgi:hypothetical protein
MWEGGRQFHYRIVRGHDGGGYTSEKLDLVFIIRVYLAMAPEEKTRNCPQDQSILS